MPLEKSGKHSTISHWMHHIYIRYFFVTDCIQSKEVAFEYCLTDKMLADMFTKPLKGPAFCCFCMAILNLPNDDEICRATILMAGHRSVLGNESASYTDQQVDQVRKKLADGLCGQMDGHE